MWIENLLDAFWLLWKESGRLAGLKFGEVHFLDFTVPFIAGIIILALVAGKVIWLFWWGDSFSYRYSGHSVSRTYRQGAAAKVFTAVPKVIFACGVAIILLALSEPFFEQIREDKKIIQSRVRIDLRDGSGSMEEIFSGTSKSKVQVAVEAHLEFLKMREGKNDRVSFWIFASFPHLVEDFIVDHELYYQQVMDAPWISWGGNIEDFFNSRPEWHIPKERYAVVGGETGGTDMILALQAIVKQFDEDEKQLKIKNERRAILMITDAQVAGFPVNELKELRRRKIRPYIIWIKSTPAEGGTAVPPELALRVREYGGEYFDVTDSNSLKRAYAAIDKLESVEVEITEKIFRWPVFQMFILGAVAVMLLAVIIALVMEPFSTYP